MMPGLNYALYTENFEIYQFHFRTYGHGVWYDETKETYDAAIDRAKEIIYQKVQKDNPHLIFFGGVPQPQTQYQQDFNQNSIADIDKQMPEVKGQDLKQQRINDLIKQINECSTVKVLNTFEFFINRQFPEIKPAYDNKLKELQNV